MRIIIAVSMLLLILAGLVPAQEPASLDEAKQLAAAEKKPILIEFFRPD